MRRFLVFFILLALGAVAAAAVTNHEQRLVLDELKSFPDSDVPIRQLRPLVAGALCFIPAAGAAAYALAGVLARYVTRQFLTIFAICMAALFSLWMLIDLSDNLEDLKQTGRAGELMLNLYLARMPQIAVELLPFGLLLSLLYCLGRLSASREIVAITQTGRGLLRMTAPFMVVGVLATVLSMGLNFYWAPNATRAEKEIVETAKRGAPTIAESQRYRNAEDLRMWMVGAFPPDYAKGAPLRDIWVIQEKGNDTLESILTADTASWDFSRRTWTLGGARRLIVEPIPKAPHFEENLPDPLIVTTWRETPAQIIRPNQPAIQLGIPDLKDWLGDRNNANSRKHGAYETQWYSRFAQPFNCLIMVVLATPLGVVFTRRGASGGVAMAIFLCGGMIFLSTISLALGDSGHLRPGLAAWLPNIVFGLLALYLFRRRLAGQPIYQTLRKFLPTES